MVGEALRPCPRGHFQLDRLSTVGDRCEQMGRAIPVLMVSPKEEPSSSVIQELPFSEDSILRLTASEQCRGQVPPDQVQRSLSAVTIVSDFGSVSCVHPLMMPVPARIGWPARAKQSHARGNAPTRVRRPGGWAVADQERPRVILRGPGEGDNIILPMGKHRAHITRKAARTETGGHWALGEAWQDAGFDNPAHAHDEAEAFYVLEGSYTFYTDAAPAENVGPGTFVLIPPGAIHGFRTGPEGGRLLAVWPSTVEAAFFSGPRSSEADE